MITTGQMMRLDADRAVWREVADEVVILDVVSSTYFNLNRAAAALWKRLETGATAEDLVSELVTKYGLPAERAQSDVRTFIDQLEGLSLLRTGGD